MYNVGLGALVGRPAGAHTANMTASVRPECFGMNGAHVVAVHCPSKTEQAPDRRLNQLPLHGLAAAHAWGLCT